MSNNFGALALKSTLYCANQGECSQTITCMLGYNYPLQRVMLWQTSDNEVTQHNGLVGRAGLDKLLVESGRRQLRCYAS